MKNLAAIKRARIVNSRLARYILDIGIAFFISLSPSLTHSFSEAKGQLVLYLETSGSVDGEIVLEIDSAALEGDAGEITLAMRNPTLNSIDISERQVLLSEFYIPEGRYDSLGLHIKDITAIVDENKINLKPHSDWVKIPINMHVKANTAEPLFVLWILESLSPESATYHPLFKIDEPETRPPGSLVFVTNEGSGNISVVDRFTYKVVDVIKAGEMPRGMAYSRLAQQLFVANSGDNSVSVIDLTSRKILRSIQLYFGDEPSRLSLSPDEQSLYIVNHGSDRLVVYDIRSFQETGSFILGTGPWGITTDRLASYVYISNRMSDDISVFEPVGQSVNGTFISSGSPSEILLNSFDNALYVSYKGERTLSVIDTQTGSYSASLNLCSATTGLAYDHTSQLLYVALGNCAEINIIKPQAGLNLGRIRLPERPGLITLDPEKSRLLVILPESYHLAVINVISKKLTGIIDVGRRPYMAIAPE